MTKNGENSKDGDKTSKIIKDSHSGLEKLINCGLVNNYEVAKEKTEKEIIDLLNDCLGGNDDE